MMALEDSKNGNANFPNARGISVPTEKVEYLQRTPVCSRKFISNPHMYTISIPTSGTEHFGQMESAPDLLSHLKQLRVNATSPGWSVSHCSTTISSTYNVGHRCQDYAHEREKIWSKA